MQAKQTGIGPQQQAERACGTALQQQTGKHQKGKQRGDDRLVAYAQPAQYAARRRPRAKEHAGCGKQQRASPHKLGQSAFYFKNIHKPSLHPDIYD